MRLWRRCCGHQDVTIVLVYSISFFLNAHQQSSALQNNYDHVINFGVGQFLGRSIAVMAPIDISKVE
ncbi:hypothetical protein OUZ56_021094 [Daphnia magna]|uniref:Uncharacterized protein n=1 Tax=Daphnia magna TaxID=35525 RepID=A0ABQ9ZGD5_9CRUS|nr:hypothetical protein OUZ56_021094 [Daphnia magna]